MTVWVDVETRSRADLPEVGAWRYAEDESTELLCLVWCRNGAWFVWVPSMWIDPGIVQEFKHLGLVLFEGNATPAPLLDAIAAGDEFVAHNAEFEAAVFEYTLGIKAPIKWVCTQAMARYFQLPPSLEDMSVALQIGVKDETGKMLIKKYCMPDQKGHLTEIPCFMGDSFVRYDVQDVLLTKTADAIMRPYWPELAYWREHLAINRRGILCDRALVTNMRRIRDALPETVTIDGTIVDPSNVKDVKAFLHKRGCYLSSLEKKSLATMLEQRRAVLAAPVIAMIEARLDAAMASLQKLDKVGSVACEDNRLRGQFKYYGTSTGRAAGYGIQLQSLVKPSKGVKQGLCVAAINHNNQIEMQAAGKGSVKECLVGALRGILVADPGHTLVIADWAQIEARGVLWLAGDMEHLGWWRTRDMYSEMATLLFARRIIKGIDDKERDVGKRTILGCNFQLAGDKMEHECEKYGINLRALGLSGEFVVKTFRDLFTSLSDYDTGLWAGLTAAMIQCIEGETTVHAFRLVFRWVAGKHVYVRLPSGRDLIFRFVAVVEEVRRTKDGREYTVRNIECVNGDGSKERYYGGKLADNFTQAICSDIMRSATMNSAAQQIETRMHQHDELVFQVPDDALEAGVAQIKKIMTTPPEWCADFPLEVDIITNKRYAK